MNNDNYKQWISQNVGGNITPESRFVFKIAGNFSWYILIQVEAEDNIKLQVVDFLIKDPKYLAAFKSTQTQQSAKTPIAEFLIYNPLYIHGLTQYIDFSVLNDPIDFISYALFINFGEDVDTKAINNTRIEIVRNVLTTDFVLQHDATVRKENIVIRKLVYMDNFVDRFKIAWKMAKNGFAIIGENTLMNAQVAVPLIENRADVNCQRIINANAAQFGDIKLQINGTEGYGNLVDYFYWVKEDMQAVKLLKGVLGLELTR